MKDYIIDFLESLDREKLEVVFKAVLPDLPSYLKTNLSLMPKKTLLVYACQTINALMISAETLGGMLVYVKSDPVLFCIIDIGKKEKTVDKLFANDHEIKESCLTISRFLVSLKNSQLSEKDKAEFNRLCESAVELIKDRYPEFLKTFVGFKIIGNPESIHLVVKEMQLSEYPNFNDFANAVFQKAPTFTEHILKKAVRDLKKIKGD